MVSKKKYLVFLEAFLVSAFIFCFGLLVGIFIENLRINDVSNNFARLEVDMLDSRLLSEVISSADCTLAIGENVNFADRVFYEAKQLEKYESSNEITESIREQHKKYDLLRAMIWMNSIKIKKNCNATYHNLVYIYKYADPSLQERAKQSVISNILGDIKEEYGDRVLLVSMAGDAGISSIDVLEKHYRINSLPAVIIDENVILTDIKNASDVIRYLI